MSDAQAPAGWFPDPEDPANLRYWDGAAWTDHRSPAVAVGPPAAPAASGSDIPAAPAYSAPYGAAPVGGPPLQNAPALVGLILAIVGTVVGLLLGLFILVGLAGAIVSIVGLVQANRMRAAGVPNDRRGLAIAGIIVGFGGVLLSFVFAGLLAVFYTSYPGF